MPEELTNERMRLYLPHISNLFKSGEEPVNGSDVSAGREKVREELFLVGAGVSRVHLIHI